MDSNSKYFREGYGIVTDNDPNTENCSLFYAEWALLNKENLNSEDRAFFSKNMELKWNGKTYNRRSGVDTRSVSHDEISGWFATSSLLGTSHGKSIWSHLVKHLGGYNNTGLLKDSLPFNPGNYYAWGSYVSSPLRFLFLPLFFINLFISTGKPPGESSGKLISWLELFSMPDGHINSLLRKFYVSRMKKQYGDDWLKKLFNIYFHMENKTEFPIFKALENL